MIIDRQSQSTAHLSARLHNLNLAASRTAAAQVASLVDSFAKDYELSNTSVNNRHSAAGYAGR